MVFCLFDRFIHSHKIFLMFCSFFFFWIRGAAYAIKWQQEISSGKEKERKRMRARTRNIQEVESKRVSSCMPYQHSKHYFFSRIESIASLFNNLLIQSFWLCWCRLSFDCCHRTTVSSPSSISMFGVIRADLWCCCPVEIGFLLKATISLNFWMPYGNSLRTICGSNFEWLASNIDLLQFHFFVGYICFAQFHAFI